MTAVFVILMGFVGLGNPPVEPHAADFNSSFSVDLADLALFNKQFGAGVGDPLAPEIPYRPADLDADGDIDWEDLVLFIAAMTSPPGERPCLSNADCDDHNPCSGEFCNLSSMCEYYDHPFCCHNDFDCSDFDPCTSVCRQESGGNPICRPAIRSCCFLDSQCDDGDDCTGDTCNPAHQCNSEPIFPCCGNGEVETGEDCDDGNNTPDDGCDEFCQDECNDLQDLCTFDAECCDSNARCDSTAPCNTAGFSTRCCLPTGTSCGQDCDCCGEGRCESGSCCSPLGASCSSDFECCFGFDVRCDSGTCCGPVGMFCSVDSDCCGESQCEGSSCCSPLGGECKSHSDCCGTNLRCDKGVCNETR